MGKDKNKRLLINIFSILIISLICFLAIGRVCENDLFFDIKTGESILKYGVDFKEHFSFIPNLTYLYHHWLYDLIIYFIYKLFSYGGIFIFFLLFYILLGITVYIVNLKYSNNKFISLLVTILTVIICKFYALTRVQTLTYLLFYLVVYFLEKLYQTGQKKYIFILLLLSIIVVNFHMPFWLFTIILVLPFLVEMMFKLISNSWHILKKIKSKKVTLESPKNTNLFLITFYSLVLSGFISPYKLKPYTFFLKTIGNESFDFIIEMQKTTPITNPIFLALVLVTLLIIIITNTKIKLRDLLLLLGLFVFSLLACRNVVFVYLFFPTYIIKILFYNFKLPKIKIKNQFLKKIIPIYKNILLNNVTLISINCLLGILLIIGLYNMHLKTFNFNIKDDYPVESVKYIKNNLDYKNIKLYTEFNYGSYIAFNDIPIFVDSRAEVYIKEFNGGNDVMKDYNDVDLYQKYKYVFNKYNFDYALVYTGTNIYYYLNNDKDFAKIYNENKTYTLFKRNI